MSNLKLDIEQAFLYNDTYKGESKMMNLNLDYDSLPYKHVLCVDMKSFYASCSAIAIGLDPRTTHLAVVAHLKRPGSVVLAASPALKHDYGIRTGSRLFEIPNEDKIITVQAQMDLYLRVSVEITRLFNKYVPKESIHTYSVDESFLEVSGTSNLWGDAEEVAKRILNELKDTFYLDAAIGIGPNMLIAKLCLDLEAKKSGIAKWTYEDIPDKLWNVSPLSKMWGIGRRLEERLNNLGIQTVGDLANFSLNKLEKNFGVMGNQLYFHAHGIDLSELGAPILQEQVSYGTSQILLRDYNDREEIAHVILEMCEEVDSRARLNKKAGKTITLQVSYSKNSRKKGFNSSTTIKSHTNRTMEIYKTCLYLFRKSYIGEPVRQISISLGNICTDTYVQLDLLDQDRLRERKLNYVMDSIRDKHGKDALLRAVSYTKAGTALERSKLIGGHYAK